ncbi:AGAP005566-PA-like protein [Anopheles sinensis]|uniref:AGAP005566-PA-like protein n=1 Tax=Anopheles sinensis TaxID=74873 RepID=A0A084WKN0_ANOSI|nr:AGAP005566-PA-like protein [Anopheles sinensis]
MAYAAVPVESSTSAAPETCLAPADTTTMQVNERGELEEVVVKDGQVFRISFVDEPMPAETSEVPYESESLPSIATELSLLMDNSKFLESAIPVNELEQTSSRDWINYDELPLLSQHLQPVSSSTSQLTQQLSDPASSCMLLNSTAMRSQDSTCDENHNNLCESRSTAEKVHCARSLDFSNYCVECEKFLPTAEALSAHMESKHRLIDEAANYGIGGEFGWSSTLNSHTNNEIETRPFICNLCTLTFPLEESFQRHNLYVHGRASNRPSSKR